MGGFGSVDGVLFKKKSLSHEAHGTGSWPMGSPAPTAFK